MRTHANIAVLVEDVDISVCWGYNPDESPWHDNRQKFDFSDFLPVFPDDSVSRIYADVFYMYADVFYQGSLVDCELLVVADGGRYYVPIPRTVYPNKTGLGPREFGEPEHHYTRWDLGFATVENGDEGIAKVLERIDFILDEDRPISGERK